MPYTTGSQGADANCAKTFMEGPLHTALSTNLTYVEEVVNGTSVCRVYKSPGANNNFGQDWFLIVRRPTDSAATVYFSVTELYNSTTHLCNNYAPSSTSLTPTAQFAVNDAAGKAPDNAALYGCDVTIAAGGFSYFLSTTKNRFVCSTRTVGTDYATYAGLYQDFLPTSISPFPLIVCKPRLYYGGTTGMATREPNTTTAVGSTFCLHTTGASPAVGQAYSIMGTDSYTGRRLFSPQTVYGRAQAYVRGVFYDFWMTNLAGVNGDTIDSIVGSTGAARTYVQMREGANGGGLGAFIDTAV